MREKAEKMRKNAKKSGKCAPVFSIFNGLCRIPPKNQTVTATPFVGPEKRSPSSASGKPRRRGWRGRLGREAGGWRNHCHWGDPDPSFRKTRLYR